MKFLFVLAIQLVLFIIAHAHTYMSNVSINGTRQKMGKCIRPYIEDFRMYPVKDFKSEDMLCRTTSMNADDTEICGVLAGSTITIEWHESDENDIAIEEHHLGPCLVYLSPLEANGAGDVWFKIFEDGYDPETEKWCVDKIVASRGPLDITIPADLKQGYYLMRTEILALHQAERMYGTDEKAGAESYPNCVQLYIIGDGTAEPPGVAISEMYKYDDPGIYFNLYDGYDSYPIPGPKLYEAGSLPASSSTDDNEVLTSVTEIENKNDVESDNKEESSQSSLTSTSASSTVVSSNTIDDIAVGATITNAAGQPCVRVRRRRRRNLTDDS